MVFAVTLSAIFIAAVRPLGAVEVSLTTPLLAYATSAVTDSYVAVAYSYEFDASDISSPSGCSGGDGPRYTATDSVDVVLIAKPEGSQAEVTTNSRYDNFDSGLAYVYVDVPGTYTLTVTVTGRAEDDLAGESAEETAAATAQITVTEPASSRRFFTITSVIADIDDIHPAIASSDFDAVYEFDEDGGGISYLSTTANVFGAETATAAFSATPESADNADTSYLTLAFGGESYSLPVYIPLASYPDLFSVMCDTNDGLADCVTTANKALFYDTDNDLADELYLSLWETGENLFLKLAPP